MSAVMSFTSMLTMRCCIGAPSILPPPLPVGAAPTVTPSPRRRPNHQQMTDHASLSTRHRSPTARPRFRNDVEGLRAIAVLLVLLHHAGLGWVPGGFVGVDIFFVVSGFVITGQLLREVESTGTINLPRFYGRRAKRLLPAASLVLVFTAVAAWLLAPRTQWSTISTDLVGASLYVVNWVFVDRSVDYLAEDVEPSPVLHFWSLAIEEQFYFIWPLLILVVIWFATRQPTNRGPNTRGLGTRGQVVNRRQLAAGLGILVVIPSLAWSTYSTATAPEQAFFTTTSRLWELGLGALVAVGAGVWAAWPRRLALAVAWLGLAAVIYSTVGFSTASAWPGSAALVPTLGAAAIIAGGYAAGRDGPQIVLGARNAVWIGGLSYSLYLWHWPLLRIAEWQWGELSTSTGLLIVTASVLPAWLSARFVERPIRFAPVFNGKARVPLLLGLVLTVTSLVAALLLGQAASRAVVASDPESSRSSPEVTAARPPSDAAAREATPSVDETGPAQTIEVEPPSPPDAEPLFDSITPDPLVAPQDLPDFYATGCQVGATEGTVTPCVSGDSKSDVVVYVVGDSKIGQWLPAIDEAAEANGWKIILHTKDSCAFTDVTVVLDDQPYTQCREWGTSVMDELREDKPAAVIVGSVRSEAFNDDGEVSSEAIVDGYQSYWSELVKQGSEVIAISDNPQPNSLGMPVYECVDRHRDDPTGQCSWDSTGGSGSEVMREAADAVEGAQYLDMNPWVCPNGRCTGVWRNVLTYRQGSHLTKTFVLALAQPLADQLAPLVNHTQ